MALIYISIGSNIERDLHISAAYLELSALFGEIRCSAVYESEAVGFDGDAFYNLVAQANTHLSVADCVAAFKAIEQKYGRPAKSPKFCGKRLDLDLLTTINSCAKNLLNYLGTKLLKTPLCYCLCPNWHQSKSIR